MNCHFATFFSWTTCPWGPSASEGRRAKYTGVSVPSSRLLGALGPPMSVLTQPGQQAFRRILSPPLFSLSFLAWILDRAVTPIFVTPYILSSGQPSFLCIPFFVSSTNLFMSPTSSSSVMVSLLNFCCSSGLQLSRALKPHPLDIFTTLPKMQHKPLLGKLWLRAGPGGGCMWAAAFPVHLGGCEKIPHVWGKRKPSKTVGVARGHQRADTLKPQSQKTSQSDHTDQSLV